MVAFIPIYISYLPKFHHHYSSLVMMFQMNLEATNSSNFAQHFPIHHGNATAKTEITQLDNNGLLLTIFPAQKVSLLSMHTFDCNFDKCTLWVLASSRLLVVYYSFSHNGKLVVGKITQKIYFDSILIHYGTS